MLFWIWEKIKLILPYYVVILMHRNGKNLGTVLKLKSGNELIPIMVTMDYGIIVTKNKYEIERGKRLRQAHKQLMMSMKQIEAELNDMSFVAKEEVFKSDGTD